MTTFEDRRDGYEAKFAHEEKLGFELEARCCKLFGLWVAEKLDIKGDAANTYAMSVVESNLDEAGFNDVIRKVRADFDQKGIAVTDHELKHALDKALTQARIELEEKK